jgi:hypothetical protein
MQNFYALGLDGDVSVSWCWLRCQRDILDVVIQGHFDDE